MAATVEDYRTLAVRRALWRAQVHTPDTPRLLRWSAERNPVAWDWSVRLRRLYASMPEALENPPA